MLSNDEIRTRLCALSEEKLKAFSSVLTPGEDMMLGVRVPLALKIIDSGKLDAWVHNKAITKSTESFRLTQEQKSELRTKKIL